MCFEDGKIVAAYDWDSLAFRPEPELVGLSTHGFTADWTLEVRRIPTADDICSYVADYQEARGRPFSKRERRLTKPTPIGLLLWAAQNTWSNIVMGRRA